MACPLMTYPKSYEMKKNSDELMIYISPWAGRYGPPICRVAVVIPVSIATGASMLPKVMGCGLEVKSFPRHWRPLLHSRDLRHFARMLRRWRNE